MWCSPSGIHSAEASAQLGASKCTDGRTKAAWCLELQGKENQGLQSVKQLIGAADGSKLGLPALLFLYCMYADVVSYLSTGIQMILQPDKMGLFCK